MQGWDHPALKDKVSTQDIWDLVAFVRSLSRPALTASERHHLGAVFGANCADCHGVKGYGDGALSHNLDPLPANFHQYDRFLERQDTMLWNHIADGLYPAAMPGFLDRQDRANNVVFDKNFVMQMVRYVRHFQFDYGPGSGASDQGAEAGKTAR